MNKKEILKRLVKDPIIKSLYTEGIDNAIVNKLIVTELMKEQDEEGSLEDRIEAARQAFRKSFRENGRYGETSKLRAEYERLRELAKNQPQLAQKYPLELKPAQPQQIIQGDEPKRVLAQLIALTAIKNSEIVDYLSMMNQQEQEKFIEIAVDNVDKTAGEDTPEEKKQDMAKSIPIEALYTYMQQAIENVPTPNTEIDISSALVPFQQEPEELEVTTLTPEQSQELLNKAVQKTIDMPQSEEDVNTIKSDPDDAKKKDALLSLVRVVKSDEDLKDIDPKTIGTAIINTIKSQPEPQGLADEIPRETFDKAYAKNLATPFDEYEEVFASTPYLSEQSRVLFALEDALEGFVKDLDQLAARDITGERTRELQEQEQNLPDKTRKKVFKYHKKMIDTLKQFLTIMGQLNTDNLTTVGGTNLRKQIKQKAKELVIELFIVYGELDKLGKQELEFLEEQEDEQTEIQLIRKNHKQIMSNLTKIDRIYRSKKADEESEEKDRNINLEKYINKPIDDTIDRIKEISKFFPIKAPFGKEADLGEIRKQMKGIGRDVLDIINKLKGLVKSDKSNQQNTARLKNTIDNAINLIIKYFDIGISSKSEIAKLVPKQLTNNVEFK